MQLLVFTAVSLVAFLIAYAFDLGGTVSALVLLTILLIGVVLRAAQPTIERLRA